MAERSHQRSPSFVGKDFDAATWQKFAPNIYYHAGDIGNADDFTALAKFLDEIEKSEVRTRVYYLATAPQFYEQAVEQLGAAGLADETGGSAG